AHPHAVHLFAAHAPDSSFPSDHATASVAIATAILLRRRWEWGAIAAVFAVLLCFGRVALGFHYPTDVLAGAAIGALSAIVLALHPLRDLLDALSDWVGGLWDRGTDMVVRTLIPGRG
ncbi:MAG: phosphatase PAP2 family protein, partial [Solirubrobacteraceae bacterium]